MPGWCAAGPITARGRTSTSCGVGAGALIAPFAFAGMSQGARSRELCATLRQGDVMVSRSSIRDAFDDGLADHAPLMATISRSMDGRMLAGIARGYAAGRLLLIATVNLDAQLALLWNIAASGHPGALARIRRVMLASAAIPGLFPPTMIDATLDGRACQEMHVDGGTFAQSFLELSSFGELAVRTPARGSTRPRRHRLCDPQGPARHQRHRDQTPRPARRVESRQRLDPGQRSP